MKSNTAFRRLKSKLQQHAIKDYNVGDVELSFGKNKRVRFPIAFISGYGFLLGWSSILLWSDGFTGEISSDFYSHTLRACFLFSISVALLVFPRIPPFNKPGSTTVPVLIMLLLSPWASIASIATLEIPLAIPFWVATGFSNALLLHLWHTGLACQNQKRLILIMGGSFVISGLTLLMFQALQPEYRHVLDLLAPVLSLIFLLGTKKDSEKRIQEYHSKIDYKLEKKRFYNKELYLSTLCNMFVGFFGSCATMSIFSLYAVPAVGCTFAVAGIIMIVTLSAIKKNVAFEFLGVLFPYTAFWLFVFALAPLAFKVLAIAAMVMIFSCFEIISTSNISRNTRYLFSDYARGLSNVRACNRLTFLLGWVVGYFAITLWSNNAIDLIVISLGLLSILSVGVIVRLFQLGLETRNRRRTSAYKKTENGESANNSDQQDTRFTGATTKQQTGDTGGSNYPSIRSIAKSYQLSPRETEVFMLLAQGRNARYISGELIVSINTVKSHAYNIYGKLGIHSQQELIDLIQNQK